MRADAPRRFAGRLRGRQDDVLDDALGRGLRCLCETHQARAAVGASMLSRSMKLFATQFDPLGTARPIGVAVATERIWSSSALQLSHHHRAFSRAGHTATSASESAGRTPRGDPVRKRFPCGHR